MTSTNGPASRRWAWAEIDLDAIEHNIGVLRRAVAPAAVWAVVKADGYGHGAVPVAERALAAGAGGLCVALTAEGVALREAGIDAPVLVLSEQPVEQLETLIRFRLTPTVYSTEMLTALAGLAAESQVVDVHVMVDTGMQRVGAPPSSAQQLLRHASSLGPAVRVSAICTHLACADELESDATELQLAAFDDLLADLDRAGLRPPLVHVANSAAALAVPAAHHDLVRVGIAMYGISPGAGVDQLAGELRPALRLCARVSHTKSVEAGSHVSYGWRHRFDAASRVATVPIGYADGVPRRLGTLPDGPGAEVLVRGRRCPIVGVVTMDQLMVDVGDMAVEVGDEVVLIGRQGDESILANDWADRLGTIGYEIVCGIGPRVPRVVLGNAP